MAILKNHDKVLLFLLLWENNFLRWAEDLGKVSDQYAEKIYPLFYLKLKKDVGRMLSIALHVLIWSIIYQLVKLLKLQINSSLIFIFFKQFWKNSFA